MTTVAMPSITSLLIQKFDDWRSAKKVSIRAAARQLDYSHCPISQWRRCRYPADSRKIEHAVLDLLKKEGVQ